uniref:EGF-like domain-containing protein n=1 Tax=Setaria digitata TaxID=48799 RepID=A0A915PHS5_9BILA
MSSLFDSGNSVEHSIQYGRTNFSCFNGGSLINGRCHCQERFEGEACEIEPCLNGGRKSKTGRCHCPYGLTGKRCETVTQCIEGKGKLENGRCKCEDRWTGIFCQSRMCHNGISVGTGGQGSFCLCDIGFTGPFCEMAIECIHGSITAENICSCASNWSGEDCNQCAYEYQLIDGDCKLIATENSLIAVQNSKAVTLWSLIFVIAAASFSLLLIGIVITIYIKKCSSKPSRVGSDAGTDV